MGKKAIEIVRDERVEVVDKFVLLMQEGYAKSVGSAGLRRLAVAVGCSILTALQSKEAAAVSRLLRLTVVEGAKMVRVGYAEFCRLGGPAAAKAWMGETEIEEGKAFIQAAQQVAEAWGLKKLPDHLGAKAWAKVGEKIAA